MLGHKILPEPLTVMYTIFTVGNWRAGLEKMSLIEVLEYQMNLKKLKNLNRMHIWQMARADVENGIYNGARQGTYMTMY